MADLTTLLSRFLTDLYAGGVLTSPFSLGPLTVATPTGASATSNYLSVVQTIPTLSAQFAGVRLELTEPESAGSTIRHVFITNTAASTAGSAAMIGIVSAMASKTTGVLSGGVFSATSAGGSTGGKHYGVGGSADDGEWNIGGSFDAYDAGTFNVAVRGNAEPTATNTIGGLFQLHDIHAVETAPPAVSAALVADNVASGLPILLALSNGTEVFRIGPTSVLSTIPFLGPDGTSAAPPFASSTTPTSGIFFPAAGAIGFTTNFEKLRINATGFHFGAQTLFFGTSATADDVALSRPAANRLRLATGDVMNLEPVAFASLPTGSEGDLASVTDSNTATWGATIAGGGANNVLAYFNGTNWTVAGA